MAVANKPYVVTFNPGEPPSKPDQSQSSADGQTSNGADRAGHTTATVKKKAEIDWDNGPARADGMVPLYATAVKIVFVLEINVAISYDYPEGSCPYRVTWKHEIDDHVKPFTQIFLSYQDALIVRLNAIKFPTIDAPRWVKNTPRDIAAVQDPLGALVRMAIQDVNGKLVGEMDADRRAKDSPGRYQAIYQQCTPEEWKMKKR